MSTCINLVELFEQGKNYKICLPNKDLDYIQKKIAGEGKPYEQDMLEDMANNLNKESLVIDVGANIGNHSLYLAAVVGCEVIAFEPNKDLCKAFKQSIKVNGLENQITLNQMAVGSGFAKLTNLDESNLGGQSAELVEEVDSEFEVIKLDDFLAVDNISVIKIDVEGMELEVLQGAKQLIKKFSPLLYVECQYLKSYEQIANTLEDWGYLTAKQYNATPTHLFIHLSQLSADQKLAIATHKKTVDEYMHADQISSLKIKLNDANLKYRQVTASIDTYKAKLAKLESHALELESDKQSTSLEKAQLSEEYLRETERLNIQLSTLQQQIQTSEQEKIAIKTELSILSDLFEPLKIESNNLNTEFRDALQKLAVMQAENFFLSNQVDSISKDYEDYLKQSKAEMDVLSQKYQEQLLISTKNISKNESLLLQIQELKTDQSELKKENQELSKQGPEIVNELNEIKVKLNKARDKYRNVSNQYNELKEFVDAQQSIINSVNQESDNVKKRSSTETLKIKQELTKAQREIERLRIEKQQAEEKVIRTRNYISFRLGYAILEARKSFKGLLKLPYTIWNLRKDELQSKKIKVSSKPKNVTSLESNHTLYQKLHNFEPVQRNVLPKKGLANLFTDMVSLKVACIMDEFTFTSYAPTCNLMQLTPKFWQKELDGFKPDLLFIESAWRGKDDLWGNKVGHCSQELQDIIAWANTNSVPTIFWNKEDPIHFETFLNTARLFDYVYTTDIDCINRYKAALGHNEIYFLPFAAQPQHSNPIEKYERKDAFCFAGAYYLRYPDRTRDLGNFVTQLPDYRPVEIYDRNFGKDDLNYQFPAEYQPFIVGNLPFEEIDKAYKGYHYAINLNSIKQSQTMFARRVYELLASNTVTVSNFSRGIRLMFGDLVVVSDSGEEVLERVKEISQTPEKLRKHKLLALRKVMSEHTYQDRFAYIVSKVQGHQVSSWHPHVVVVGYAKGDAQFKSIVANFKRQVFDNKKLYIVVPNNSLVEQVSQSEKIQDSAIKIVTLSDLNDISMGEWLESFDWFAAMVPDDYYGVNYLMDLVLATRYVQSSLIAKSTHYVLTSNHELKLAWPNRQYKFIQACPVRSTLIKVTLLKAESAREWLKDIYTKEYKATEAYQAFAIDEFNYCKNTGSEPLQKVTENVDDLTGLNVGIGIDDLLHKAEKIQPAEVLADSAPVWSTEKLSTLFKTPKSNKAEVTVNELGLHIKSNLQDGQNEYIYATQDFTLDELGYSKETPFFLDTTPGLNIQLVILFLDANKQRISHVIKHANRNQNAEIPLGTEYIRLGLRIYAGGEADVKALVLGHRPLLPSEVVGQSDHLLLTNNYPSYDDLYRNGFVHSRVVAYKEQGIDVDVYRLRKDEAISYHEFKNINVMTGSQQALDKLLKNGSYKSILVHFLDPDMWHVLKNYINKVKVYVWVHGADIQAWHRRAFNYDTEEQRANAKKQSDIRLSFWRSLLTDKHPNLKLVFVSKYSAESSMEDLGIQLNKSAYEIIHNPIDMDLFNYVPKPVEQRKKILSIRPYASKVYANDLTVKVILELAKEPFFKELEFRLIGDGVLFDEIVEPLRGFDNVIIEKKFLQQKEIAELHKQYGIFLCPTRMDSQGVSRDEAMSSGLVPVTNNVAAIPEFVDMDSGVLANAENYMELAVGIVELFNNPDKFSELSSNASNIVRNKSVKELIVSTEINFFKIALKDENP